MVAFNHQAGMVPMSEVTNESGQAPGTICSRHKTRKVGTPTATVAIDLVVADRYRWIAGGRAGVERTLFMRVSSTTGQPSVVKPLVYLFRVNVGPVATA